MGRSQVLLLCWSTVPLGPRRPSMTRRLAKLTLYPNTEANMLSQKNPNAWSCLPTAFASVLNVPVELMIAQIGHDGSEITHAGLPEPLKRRGFHPQECIEVCMRDGMAVTQIEVNPCAVPAEAGAYLGRGVTPKMFSTITGESCQNRFERHLFNSRGVIDCRTRFGRGHALAYEGYETFATISDPIDGEIFTYRRVQDAAMMGLYFVSLFRLDEIH